MEEHSNNAKKGSVTLIAALSLVVLAGFAAFAVDFGYLQWKKSVVQNAVDAGALAGAAVLVSSGSSQDSARSAALAYARRHLSAADSPELAVTAADVSFPSATQVEVTAGLTAARGNPVALFLGRVLGREHSDVMATARAGSFCVSGTKCVKPWSPPTKFTWNDYCEADAKLHNGVLDSTSACEVASVQVQGYGPDDVGTPIVLKIGDPQETVAPGQFGPVDLPPANKGTPTTGASAYALNIAGCTGTNTVVVESGDTLQLEPGNMVGPTRHGVQELLAQDPGAYWDSATNSIKGSSYPDPSASPRVAMIAFYDPRQPPQSGRNSLVVYQVGAVFVEGLDGSGNVRARFIQILALPGGYVTGGNCGLLFSVRLQLDSSRAAR